MVSALHLSFLALAFGLVSATHLSNHVRSDKRHHAAARRRNITTRGQTYSGRATWFPVGLGACGETNVPSDMMVALNYLQYGDGYPGPECFKTVTIEYNGVQQVATILDECPEGSCDAVGQLDMSTGLFSLFADLSVGEFEMTWWFNDDPPTSGTDDSGNSNNNGNDDDNSDQTSTSSTDPAPWTSTQTTTSTSWSDPAPWTSSTTSTTSTTSSSTSSSSTTSTTSSSSSSTSSSSVGSVTDSGSPTTAVAPSISATPQRENMLAMDDLVVAFEEIVVAGVKI